MPALLLVLLAAALLSASPTVHTAFSRIGEGVRLVHTTGPFPIFATGASSASGNPAFLADFFGQEAGLAVEDLAHPFCGDVYYQGRFLQNAALGISSTHLSRDHYQENRSALFYGASVNELSFGVLLKTLYATDLPDGAYHASLFALDADVGLLYGWNEMVYAALSAGNLVSPNIVNTYQDIIHPSRSLGFQLGVVPDLERRLAFFAEAGMDSLHGLAIPGYFFGSGTEMTFFEARLFTVSVAFHSVLPRRKAERENSLFAVLSGNLPVAGKKMKLEYGFRKHLSGNAAVSDDLSHSAGLAFLFGGKGDYVAPVSDAEADRESFSPDGDAVEDRMNFRLIGQDDPAGKGIKKWAFILYLRDDDNRLHPVKSFSGSGVPPRFIAWDGRNSRSELVSKGMYYYQLRVTDFDHNFTDSKLKVIYVR
ncbi:MAG: hypothetical protein A2293_09865 [Elusimicrobia bacterium RIFOXYB2_FULL_49_7]|nr:MAG: hypothetical protein A2293_09865 [Elusimicrobia bacterium RIFOXYB2_FULL_49_7]